MQTRRFWILGLTCVVVVTSALSIPAPAADVKGTIKSVDTKTKTLIVTEDETKNAITVRVADRTRITSGGVGKVPLDDLKTGSHVLIHQDVVAAGIDLEDAIVGTVKSVDLQGLALVLTDSSTLKDHPLKLPSKILIEKQEDPKVKAVKADLGSIELGSMATVYQTDGVPSRIVVTDGPSNILEEFWENFSHNLFKPLLLFFYMGFLVPIFRVKFDFPYVIYQGLTIYLLIAIGWKGGEELSHLAANELGSALGFMVVGFLLNFIIGVLAYFGLKIMTTMRRIDKATVAGFYGSDSAGTFVTCLGVLATIHMTYDAYMPVMLAIMEIPGCLVALYLVSQLRHKGMDPLGNMPDEPGYDPNAKPAFHYGEGGHNGGHAKGVEDEKEMSLEKMDHPNNDGNRPPAKGGFLSLQLLHEVFLNPGLYLLFGGIIIGFISGKQGADVTRADDNFFVALFQGILCLFLLEMGMTASRKLKDLKTAGWGYIAFGLIAPNIFAAMGIIVAHAYSMATHTHFQMGTYVLFSVLCAAASYIAVPAVQRLAIPEASPTLPLAASLGLTFSYNVTIGIPVYIEIAKAVARNFPVS